MKKTFLLLIGICLSFSLFAQEKPHIDSLLPVRGLAIAAPSKSGLQHFINFVEKELVPAKFNMLILRVDYNYAYTSLPHLANPNPLSKEDVKKLVEMGRKHGIKIVPQINLLGHQSWAKETGNLLKAYPEFDETPHVKTENYEGWPNEWGLYCKSYCPLHPEVHNIVFQLVDEIMDAFEAEYFHAGMDEVFYIGDDKCPRCSGRDKAELFAGEVTKIRNHLAQKGRKLMIGGDRLIDGKATGIGMWEASMNNTHRAIDLIPKDVFICDWHYERPDHTAVMFAMKGFDVVTCPWRKPDVTYQQLLNMMSYRKHSTKAMAERFKGMIATVWSPAERFLEAFYHPKTEIQEISDVNTLKLLINEFKKL